MRITEISAQCDVILVNRSKIIYKDRYIYMCRFLYVHGEEYGKIYNQAVNTGNSRESGNCNGERNGKTSAYSRDRLRC